MTREAPTRSPGTRAAPATGGAPAADRAPAAGETHAAGGREPEGPLVLASGSPRRRELLTRAGVVHEVVPPDVDEREEPGEEPTAMATRLAREKALAVAAALGAERPPRWVLGADTIVVLDGSVLGKPADAAHARQMLARLSGREHRVVTGVAVVHSATHRHWTTAVTSHVVMRAAGAEEIAAYVATGEPLDKAGGYAVQGEGGRRLVTAVEGSESNVIGLPVEETLALLERAARELADAAPDPPGRGS